MVAIFVVATIIAFLTIDYFIEKTEKRKKIPARAAARPVRFLMPRGFFFGKGHTWVELLPSGNTRIGIDDFVQKIVGKIDEISPLPPGKLVKKGDAIFTIRQGDKTLTFKSPISGKILDINAELTEVPDFLKNDPYREGWIVVIEPTSLPSEIRELTIGEYAANWLKEEIRKFRNFITSTLNNEQTMKPAMAATTMMDGGVPINGALESSPVGIWRGFEEQFLKQE